MLEVASSGWIYLPFNKLKWLTAQESCIEFCTAAILVKILAWYCIPNFHLIFRDQISPYPSSVWLVYLVTVHNFITTKSEHWPKTVTSSTRWDIKCTWIQSVLRCDPVCESSLQERVQVHLWMFWCCNIMLSKVGYFSVPQLIAVISLPLSSSY